MQCQLNKSIIGGKRMIVSIVIGCVLGALVGVFAPTIPYEYSKYTAVAIMAAFDSVIGAINSIQQKNFSMKIFVSGFFTNAFIAIVFTMFGERLDVDISLAAIFVFVYRIFNNLSIIRRSLLEGHSVSKK